MVCSDCQKKLGRVICPDPWKDGARNTAESGGRKVNENKLLSKTKRYTPLGTSTCRLCKATLHDQGIYCQPCAYKKGICSMCGKKVMEDLSLYKQSAK